MCTWFLSYSEMSAVHYVPGDGNPTQDAEGKVPDSSVGSDPMIPVSKYQHYGNFGDFVMENVWWVLVFSVRLLWA